jgi:hypothetical protein
LTGSSEPPGAAPTRGRTRRVELFSVALLSVAGVAASWSSYQAARWGGVQATEYSRASALRLESTRASSTADQLRAVDLAMFMNWIEAYAGEDSRSREFYERRFRPEFRPAFEKWVASRPLRNPDAAASPFHLAEYRLAKADEAGALVAQAEQVFKEGQEANRRSDAYVATAVVLASVLFFSGIAQQFRILPVQLTLLGTATVLLMIGLFNIATLPKLP